MSAEGAARIREDAARRATGTSRVPGLLAAVGTICLALAVAAFVAANWEDIPRAGKLSGILLLLGGAHATAGWAASRGRTLIADLLTMFATLVFVSGLALVGQMYHLPTDWPGGAMLVTLGALAAAWACASRASLVVASIAASCWLLWLGEMPAPTVVSGGTALALLGATGLHAARFPSLAGRWAVLAQATIVYGWLVVGLVPDPLITDDRLGVALLYGAAWSYAAALVLAGRFGERSARPGPGDDAYRVFAGTFSQAATTLGVLTLALIALAALMMGAPDGDVLVADVAVLLPWPVWAALALALVATAGLVLRREEGDAALAVSGVVLVTLLAAVAAVALPDEAVPRSVLALATVLGISVVGTMISSRLWSGLGNLALAAALFYLFHETIGSLLGQSVFFMIAGLVLVIAAVIVSRRLRRKGGRRPAVAGEGGE